MSMPSSLTARVLSSSCRSNVRRGLRLHSLCLRPRAASNVNVGFNSRAPVRDWSSVSSRSFSTSRAFQPVTDVAVSRIMLPDDANFAGNVHGGTILKMCDEAGYIVAMKHCNKEFDGAKTPGYYAALARIDHMDFRGPMYIGELANVHAEVIYASAHSIEVEVAVQAEDLITGEKRITNRARLWYVGVANVEPSKCRINVSGNLPPVEFRNPELEQLAKARYEKQKAMRLSEDKRLDLEPIFEQGGTSSEDMGVTSLYELAEPSDCNSNGSCQGGFILKMMDEGAAVSALRHCRTNVVTAAIETLNFRRPMFAGQLIGVHSKPIFVSKKSIEIKVTVSVEDLKAGRKYSALSSSFIFVSLDPNGKPLAIPPLPPPSSEQEVAERQAALTRYEKRKQS